MEVEIKLHVGSAIPGGPLQFFQELARVEHLNGIPLGPVQSAHLRDVYFDTEARNLAEVGAGLRLRVSAGRPLVTLKLIRDRDGALTQRDEFEADLNQERLDWALSHVSEQVGPGPFPVERFRAGLPCGSLVPVLEVETSRLWRTASEYAVLAMDVVRYPGVSSAVYLDVEVELVEGGEHTDLLRQIESALRQRGREHITPAVESKLERGLRLRCRGD